jgi:hypothetical protein
MARVNISTLNITITGNARGLLSATNASRQSINRMARDNRAAANGLSQSFAEFNKILARTIALYAAFKAADAVGGTLIDGVRLAANAEQTAVGFEVLLGSAEAAKKTIADLYEFVETTPFRLEEVQQSTKLLAAYGIEQKKLQATMRALGDIASATGDPLTEIANLYGRTRVENRLYTRDLNQFNSRGIRVAEKMAEQFGVSTTEIKQMAEAGTLYFADIERAIASLTGRGGEYFELTQRQAETTAGEFSNFLDEVDALKREFGAGLLPTLREFLGLARELITGTDDGASSLQAMREAGEKLGDALRSTVAMLQSTYASLIQVNIGFAEVLNSAAQLTKFSDALNFTPFTAGYLDDLNRQYDSAIARAEKLFDLTQNLYKPIPAASDEATLADLLGNLSDEAIGARKQLELLEQNAVATANKIRKEYASPLEKFKETVRELAQASIAGDLEPKFLDRALTDEIDKLRESYRELKNELKDNVAIERGSQEDLADQFKRRFSEQRQEDEQDLKKLIADITKAEKERAEQIKESAEQTAAAVNEMKEESFSAAKNVAALGDAAKKTTEVILNNLTKGLIKGASAGAEPGQGGGIVGVGARFARDNINESDAKGILRQLLGFAENPSLQSTKVSTSLGAELGKSINAYFQRTSRREDAANRDQSKPDRLREPSNTNRRDTAQRTDKELQRVVASTSQNEVQRLDRIAGAIERAPLQTIEVVEYRA